MLKPRLARVLRVGSTVLCLFALTSLAPHLALAQVSVGDGGTPSFSQPISVPPGVAGMSPKLSLLYAGGGVNGPLGHGWSVQGLSAITRCAATLAQDGKRVGVLYAATDKLCLDGQRLIQTDETGNPTPSGGNNAAGIAVTTQVNDAQGLGSSLYREFRTEKDMYARVRAYGYANGDTTGASGPAYFKVWTKAGQIYEYGQSPSSNSTTAALIAAPGKAPMAWAVARISDTLGNYIDFKYEQRDLRWGSGPTAGAPTWGHEWNILEIQYSGNKVVFNYDLDGQGNDVRTDKAEAYQLGNKNISARRLKSITSYVNSPASAMGANGGTPVRTTQLSYEYGPVTGRSRIVKIQNCTGGPTSTRCLPATTLTYAAGGNESYLINTAFSATPLASLDLIAGTKGVVQDDFNGDGKTDLLIWSDDPSGNQLWLSKGDGTFVQSTNFNITDQNLFKSDGCYTTLLADIDGDGLPDLVRYKGTTNASGNVACGTYGPILIYRNNGDGTFKPLTYSGPALYRNNVVSSTGCTGMGCNPSGISYSAGSTFYLMDVDGDGIADIVSTISPAWQMIFANSPPYGVDPCSTQVCTWVYKGDGAGGFSSIPTNLANVSVYTDNRSNRIGSARSLIDIDGDGLTDLNAVGIFPPKILSYRSRGDGNFDATGTAPSCDNSIDFNGDGRGDCLVPGDTASANALKSTNGGASFVGVGNFNLTSPGQELKGTGVGVLVLDFNGDGRQDILRWKDDPAGNAIYLSNGDGTFTQSNTFNLGTGSSALALTQLQKSDGSSSILLGDFTGRGAIEILRLQTLGGTTSNRLLTKVDSTPADQLISVTSSSGLKSNLYYVPLSNSTPANGVSDFSLGARYVSDQGNSAFAVANAIDITAPMYVVATQVDDTGVGSSVLTTEMTYRGLKADRRGRGLLGFREVLRQRQGADGSPLTVDTQYLQVHPYIGVAANTATYRSKLNATSSSTLLSSTTNNYCDQSNAGAASSSSSYCPVSAKVARPYLYLSTETGQDLAGIALPTVTTQNTFNGSGDPTAIVVTTTGTTAGVSQTFTKSVSNTYFADATSCSDFQTCSWTLGRLNQATVTNTVPNSLSSFASSAGNGAYATATAGTGPVVNSPLTFVLSNCTSTTPTLSPTPATYSCQLGNSGTSNATNLVYATSANALVVNGPTSCAANTTNCGTVTMQTSATAGVYTGKFTVSSAGATASSANVTLTVTAPNGLGVSSASFSPTSVTAGNSSSFSWSTTGAASAAVSCTGTGVTVTGTATGAAGNVTVNTTTATTAATCTVTASAASGASVTSTANLTVSPAGSVGVSSANFSPTSVAAGLSSTFSWTTVNAASASVSCSGAGATATGSGTSGNITVSTTTAGTATCTVTAVDAGGATATSSSNLTVTAAAAPTIATSSFSAANVTVGGTSTFTWSASNATSTSANCSGAVSGSGTGTATSGSLTATAGASQGLGTCTVTAVGPGGTTTGSGNINVVLAPSVSSANFSPTSVTAGASSTFSWTTANATSASVSCSGAGATATGSGTSGNLSVSTGSAGMATCAVTAVNAAGTTATGSANLTVTAPPAPSVTSNTFGSANVTTSGTTSFSWSVSNATSSSASCSGAVSGSGTGTATGGSLTATAGASAGVGTCTVTAVGAGGTTTGSSTVNVVLPPSVSSASFSPTSVTAGGSSTFSWSTANATSASVSCTGAGTTATGSGTSGNLNVGTSSAGTATCTVTATNAAGSTATGSNSLTVVSPPTITTSSNQQYLTAGLTQQGIFSWNAGGSAASVAVSCTGTGNQSGSYNGSSLSNGVYVGGTTAGATLTCTATASNPQGATASSSQTFNVVAAPAVPSAYWSPSGITLGGSSTLSWSATNAVSMGISCSGVTGTWSPPVGLNAPSGNSIFTPTSTGTQFCTLTAANAAGSTASASTNLTVVTPPTITTSSNQQYLTAGLTQQGVFSWNAGGSATSVVVSCAGTGNQSGSYSGSSLSNGVYVGGTTAGATLTCTATASNPQGATASSSQTFNVVAAPAIQSAYWSPSAITLGGSSTLSWSATNAVSMGISCSGVTGTWSPPVGLNAPTGSSSFTPSSAGTQTCTLTATNSAGSMATGTFSLGVSPPPSIQGTYWSPSSVTLGQSSTLTWSSTNAVSMGISCSGVTGAWSPAVGLNAPNGSSNFTASSAGTQVCTLTASNSAGATATGTFSLPVNPVAPFSVTGPSGSTWTFTNPNSIAQTITGLSLQFGSRGNPMGATINGGTCAVNGSVPAGGSCTVIVYAPASDCTPDDYGVAPVLTTAAGSVTGSSLTRNASAGSICR